MSPSRPATEVPERCGTEGCGADAVAKTDTLGFTFCAICIQAYGLGQDNPEEEAWGIEEETP